MCREIMERIAAAFLRVRKKREFISALRSMCEYVCVLVADRSTAAHGGAAAEA